MKKTAFLSMLLVSGILGGCVYATGIPSDDTVRAEPTLGQELLDLDRAHTKGIISDAEFDRAKSELLNERH